jgi:gluconate 2-dehydrogenase gamma chain
MNSYRKHVFSLLYPFIPDFCYSKENRRRSDNHTMQNGQTLNSSEREILAAIAERIFPQTETPGAVEIGALDYIQIALAGDYAALLPLYRQGLRAAEEHARLRFGTRFVGLSEAQQDVILGELEAGRVAQFKKAAEFFETVRYHVLEGVFCEPQYGGNKDMLGWRLVNFPGQQWGYADAYVNKPVDLEPVAVDYREKAKK